MTCNKSMRLSEVKTKGIEVKLKNIWADQKTVSHLKNLGLVPGTKMDILFSNINGTVVLVRDGKLALGSDIIKALEVDLVDGKRVS